MADTPPWLSVARSFLGVEEVGGSGNNPTILGFVSKIAAVFPVQAKYAGLYKSDDTAWCGVFVARCLADVPISGPYDPGDDLHSWMWADAWMSWGVKSEPRVGAILCFGRHVAFLNRIIDADTYEVIGGNQSSPQGGAVTLSRRSASDVKAIRWPNVPAALPAPASHPEIMLGASGPAVIELQTLLKIAVTGQFDVATDAAVRTFQAAHGLDVDGEVGPLTWGMLLGDTPVKAVLTSKGSWYSQFDGTYRWRDGQDKPNSAALGVPDDAQGIARPQKFGTLGTWFAVRAPNGRVSVEIQSDHGPGESTGRTIDISAAAAERFGYSPDNFPTDSIFAFWQISPPTQVVGLSKPQQAIKYRDIRKGLPIEGEVLPPIGKIDDDLLNLVLILSQKGSTMDAALQAQIIAEIRKAPAANRALLLQALGATPGTTTPLPPATTPIPPLGGIDLSQIGAILTNPTIKKILGGQPATLQELLPLIPVVMALLQGHAPPTTPIVVPVPDPVPPPTTGMSDAAFNWSTGLGAALTALLGSAGGVIGTPVPGGQDFSITGLLSFGLPLIAGAFGLPSWIAPNSWKPVQGVQKMSARQPWLAVALGVGLVAYASGVAAQKWDVCQWLCRAPVPVTPAPKQAPTPDTLPPTPIEPPSVFNPVPPPEVLPAPTPLPPVVVAPAPKHVVAKPKKLPKPKQKPAAVEPETNEYLPPCSLVCWYAQGKTKAQLQTEAASRNPTARMRRHALACLAGCQKGLP